jgi:hypothetical protein
MMKEDVKKMEQAVPKELMQKISLRKLTYARYWCVILQLIWLINQFLNLGSDLPGLLQLVHWLFSLVTISCLIISRVNSNKYCYLVKPALILSALRLILALFQRSNITQDENPQRVMLSTMILFKGLLFTQFIITSVFVRTTVPIHLAMTVLECMAMFQRAFGFDI